MLYVNAQENRLSSETRLPRNKLGIDNYPKDQLPILAKCPAFYRKVQEFGVWYLNQMSPNGPVNFKYFSWQL